jgi:hypothetical protein
VERIDFTNTASSWWLNGDAPEFSVGEPRKDIGGYLGWGRESEWYRDERKLDELYTLLEKSPHEHELVRTIDDATDEIRQAAWLKEVADLLNPEQPQAGGGLAGEVEADQPEGADAAAEESTPMDQAASVPGSQEKASPFGSSGAITAELQPAVDDLAALVADAVAEVPGAEELSAQELAELVAEVLAGQ